MPKVTMFSYGPWNKITMNLAGLAPALQSSAVWGQRKSAERLVKIVKDHIDNQDLGWPKLSPDTLTGDPRILVDNQEYYNSIKAWKKGNTYFAGVPAGSVNSRGIRISLIALVHEHGTARVPRRELWRPSVEELGHSKGVRNTIATSIYNKIKLLQV